MNKKQFLNELNMCLVEQGFDWYKQELDFIGLALLGLIELHKKDIDKLAKELVG